MKRLLPLALSIAALLGAPTLRAAEPEYPVSEDSKPHENVPKGEMIKFDFAQSKIFPGTTREVQIYVPKQYDGTKPACVYVNQDGVQWNAPVVFDNLIAKGEMPVTIGVFAKPGVVRALDGSTALDRFNRSYEYDGMGDGYARFVLEELLPAVEQKTTSDGRKIILSKEATTVRSAAAAAGRSAHLSRRGSGPRPSRAYSPASARWLACAGRMCIPRSSANMSRSRCASSRWTAAMTTTSTAAIGGWPTRNSSDR